MTRRPYGALAVIVLVVASACGGSGSGGSGDDQLTLYSGRTRELIGKLLQQFEKDSGVDVKVRYGETPQLANALIEEGSRTRADMFWAQDAGSLSAVAAKGLFAPVPDRLGKRVPAHFRADDATWVGTSARSRVVAFNPDRVKESDLPASVMDFIDPKWKGRIGWAPVNGSFQSFVTALRKLRGDAAAKAWIEGMLSNHAVAYPNNILIVQAVGRGEIDVGLVNHYYLYQLKKQDPKLDVVNHFFTGGDPGALVNASGVGILKGAKHHAAAVRLVDFLLSSKAQRYFTTEDAEYPLVAGVPARPGLPPLDSLQSPEIDLSQLTDLRGTERLLTDAGAL